MKYLICSTVVIVISIFLILSIGASSADVPEIEEDVKTDGTLTEGEAGETEETAEPVVETAEEPTVSAEELAAAMALMIDDFPFPIEIREYKCGPDEPAPEDVPFTGLIVIADDIGLERELSPVVLDEDGNIIYGRLDVDAETARDVCIVAYAETIEDAQMNCRAGTSPLIIEGLRVDELHPFNVVISNDDAIRILLANAYYDFLSRMKVVFVDGGDIQA
jgi:hypothetical protein